MDGVHAPFFSQGILIEAPFLVGRQTDPTRRSFSAISSHWFPAAEDRCCCSCPASSEELTCSGRRWPLSPYLSFLLEILSTSLHRVPCHSRGFLSTCYLISNERRVFLFFFPPVKNDCTPNFGDSHPSPDLRKAELLARLSVPFFLTHLSCTFTSPSPVSFSRRPPMIQKVIRLTDFLS